MPTDHDALARTLENRVLHGPGKTEPQLRRAVAACAAGGAAVAAPYGDLARRIGRAPVTVSDGQVAEVVKAAGSEKAAFEIVIAAAVGAGLARWRRAVAIVDEDDAAA